MTRMSDGRRASFVIPVVQDRQGQISGCRSIPSPFPLTL